MNSTKGTKMQIEQKGCSIVITIDIDEAALAAAEPSASGKTKIVATTRGFTRVGPVALSLNCILREHKGASAT
jgi:hypothetical protein